MKIEFQQGVGAALLSLRQGAGEKVGARRLRAAKTAFVTRRVKLQDAALLVQDFVPGHGDLLLAEVLSIGHHTKLEAPTGRRVALYPGDEIIVTYGARYATDQFEAVVPDDLEPCELIAAGGIAGRLVSQHGRMRQATRLKPLGLLADLEGHILNLRRYALPRIVEKSAMPIVVAVVGTAMNAGKTTVASSLVHGLTRAGLRVGGAKITGTGSGGDLWSLLDAGALCALDFTDMGYSSTHRLAEVALTEVANDLVDHLSTQQLDIAIVEIADGLLQEDTAALLSSPAFRSRIDAVIMVASDSMGAVAGVKWLAERRLPVVGFSGLVTASPLASAEAERACGLPSFSLDDLRDPGFAPKLCLASNPLVLENQCA